MRVLSGFEALETRTPNVSRFWRDHATKCNFLSLQEENSFNKANKMSY